VGEITLLHHIYVLPAPVYSVEREYVFRDISPGRHSPLGPVEANGKLFRHECVLHAMEADESECTRVESRLGGQHWHQQQPIVPTVLSHGGLLAQTACQFIAKATQNNHGRRSLGERLESALLPRKRKSGTFPAFTDR
jgi:hypothetical protein